MLVLPCGCFAAPPCPGRSDPGRAPSSLPPPPPSPRAVPRDEAGDAPARHVPEHPGRAFRHPRNGTQGCAETGAPRMPHRTIREDETGMAGELNGKMVAVLATDGVEQVELTEPVKALKEA